MLSVCVTASGGFYNKYDNSHVLNNGLATLDYYSSLITKTVILVSDCTRQLRTKA